jgi:agmatine/peptidylarginine deiminase
MSGNSVFRHQHSGILSLAAVEAPNVVTSDWIDEQLADTYARNGMRAGLLAGLAGIEERRWWDADVSFANHYLANDAVIVPVGADLDDPALDRLAEIHPDRAIVPVPGITLALGGGGPHCITQQIPAGVALP